MQNTIDVRNIDELLRRELRIGDPRSPAQVALALRQRYADGAVSLDQETLGLSVSRTTPTPLVAVALRRSETPGARAFDRACANIEVDCATLVEAPGNREWKAELTGWRGAFQRELQDGAEAARMAQDPAMREQGFLSVRRLCDFARIARLVGVMNPEMACAYRRLATSLDEAAYAMRILMGEALYEVGLADGGIILQVPLVDVRERKEAVILTLRQLIGKTAASDDDSWGNAMYAYRKLMGELDRQGAGELKPYLREAHLGYVLDVIMDGISVSHSAMDGEGLRQLAATIPVEVTRLRRVLRIAADVNEAETLQNSAAMGQFVQALRLFLDAFGDVRSGARLIDLALPLPLAAWQSDEADGQARASLRDLVSLRAEFAREVESHLGSCSAGPEALEYQVKMDKVLMDLDRAIDLYARGEGYPGRWGPEEYRAAVLGRVAGNLAEDAATTDVEDVPGLLAIAGALALYWDACDLVSGPDEERRVPRPLSKVKQVQKEEVQDPAEPPVPMDLLIEAWKLRANGLGLSEALRRRLAGAGIHNFERGYVDPEGYLSRFLDEKIDDQGKEPDQDSVSSEEAIEHTRRCLNAAMTAVDERHWKVAEVLAGRVWRLAGVFHARALVEGLSQPEREQYAAVAGAAAAAARATKERVAASRRPERPPFPTVIGRLDPIWAVLRRIASTLAPPSDDVEEDVAMRMLTVFEEQVVEEEEWIDLVRAMAPRCFRRADLVTAGRDLLHGSAPNFGRRGLGERPPFWYRPVTDGDVGVAGRPNVNLTIGEARPPSPRTPPPCPGARRAGGAAGPHGSRLGKRQRARGGQPR